LVVEGPFKKKFTGGGGPKTTYYHLNWSSNERKFTVEERKVPEAFRESTKENAQKNRNLLARAGGKEGGRKKTENEGDLGRDKIEKQQSKGNPNPRRRSVGNSGPDAKRLLWIGKTSRKNKGFSSPILVKARPRGAGGVPGAMVKKFLHRVS